MEAYIPNLGCLSKIHLQTKDLVGIIIKMYKSLQVLLMVRKAEIGSAFFLFYYMFKG